MDATCLVYISFAFSFYTGGLWSTSCSLAFKFVLVYVYARWERKRRFI